MNNRTTKHCSLNPLPGEENKPEVFRELGSIYTPDKEYITKRQNPYRTTRAAKETGATEGDVLDAFIKKKLDKPLTSKDKEIFKAYNKPINISIVGKKDDAEDKRIAKVEQALEDRNRADVEKMDHEDKNALLVIDETFAKGIDSTMEEIDDTLIKWEKGGKLTEKEIRILKEVSSGKQPL